MKLGKVLSSVATTLALVAGSLAFIQAPAQAATAPADLYGINIANQSSEGDARDFVTYNHVTYFSATTLQYGRSIWGVSDTPGAQPELIADAAEGKVIGNPYQLSIVGHYLFFWDNITSNWTGNKPFIVDLNTKVVKQLTLADTTAFASWNYASQAVEINGKAYFIGDDPSDSNHNGKIFSYDLTANDGTVVPEASAAHYYSDSRAFELGGKFVFQGMVQNGCCNTSTRISFFDPATKAITNAVDSTQTEIQGALAGKYTYNGSSYIIATAGQNNAFKVQAIDATGASTQIASLNDQYAPTLWFNVNGELYARNWQWPGNLIYHFNTSTQSTENVNSTMFPTATNVYISNGTVVSGNYVFAARVDASHERLYKWDGSTAAVQLGTVESLKETFADYAYSGNFSRNESMGAIGDNLVLNMALDDSIGYEPYTVSLSGTVTLLKDFNTGTEGSSPNSECIGSANGKDYMPADMPIQASDRKKGVVLETYNEGGYLRYNVLDIGSSIAYLCGFASKGTDIYFTAYSSVDGDGLYKMAADHTVTQVGLMNNGRARKATIVGDKYYYWNDNYYDLWVYDLTTNTETQLTGDQNISGVYSDNLDNLTFVGNFAFFTDEDRSDYKTYLYSVDMSASTYTENKIVLDANATADYYGYITAMGGNLYLDFTPIDGEGPNLYKVVPSTSSVTKVFDFDTNANGDGWLNGLSANATDVYASYESSGSRQKTVYKFAGGTTSSAIALPNGEQAVCAAALNGDVALTNTNGDVYFYGTGGAGIRKSTYSFGSNNSDTLCYATSTALGTYLEMPEYAYNGGSWDWEYGFIGSLVPWAKSRLGVDVNEAPAAALSSNISNVVPVTPGAVTGLSAVAGSGAVNLSWTAPTTGTTPRYAITSTPIGATCVISGTTASCTGTAGTSYTFTVKAGNDAGISAGVTSGAVVMPAAGAPTKVDTDNPDLGSLTETKTFTGSKGSVTFPDGSGFDVDSKGRIFSKFKSKYLVTVTGKITVTYKVGKVTKTYTCVLKPYGSKAKLKKFPSTPILYKSRQGCQMPAAAISAMKVGKITIVQKATMTRYYPTTASLKNPAGKAIKKLVRNMTVKMGK